MLSQREHLNTNTLNFDVSQLTAQAKQELVDFYLFLLQRYATNSPAPDFAPTQLESLDAPSVYTGPPLSLEDMEEAVRVEAGKHTGSRLAPISSSGMRSKTIRNKR